MTTMDVIAKPTEFEGVFQNSVAAFAWSETEVAVRRSALDRFLAVGVPTTHDEEWKYTSLRNLAEQSDLRVLGTGAEPKIVSHDDCRLVVSNGEIETRSAALDGLKGVTVRVNRDATTWNSVASFDGKLGSTNDARFLDLNTAVCPAAIEITVDRGVIFEQPITIVYRTSSDTLAASAMPRLILHLVENAQAKVIEEFESTGMPFTNAVAEVRLEKFSILEHTRIQDESLQAIHIGQVWVHQEADSQYLSTSIQFGAAVGRCDINVYINGEHTETWLNGTYVGKGTQVLDNHTRIDHAVPNCHSFEVYKGILDEQSTGVFNGKIFVYQDAQKTDAKQTNQALLLSPTANINTKPQLEIFADDVKCTHGATVGQLREDALYYLRSRGIPKVQAENLLVYAFAAEVIERISLADLRERLESQLFAKLNSLTS